jgi:hypothetical protein
MSAEPQLEYLTTSQVAERIGVKPKTVRQTLWRGLMPEPDLILMNHPLWLADTIDQWRAKKGKIRKKSRRVTRPERVKRVPATTLPKNARLSRGSAPSEPLVQATVSKEIAAKIAATLRAEGQHCTVPDVQTLAQTDPDELDYDRRKLQQRINRKLRELTNRP